MKFVPLAVTALLAGCSTVTAQQVDNHPSRCASLTPEERLAINLSSRPVYRQAPNYPSQALAAAQTGYVQFTFDLSEDGTPVNVQLLKSAPGDIFVAAATRAFKAWRYAPVVKDGRAVFSECHSVQLAFNLG